MRMTLVGYSLPLRLFQRRFCSRIAHHQIPQAMKKPADRHGSNKSSPAVWPIFPLDATCSASGYPSVFHYIVNRDKKPEDGIYRRKALRRIPTSRLPLERIPTSNVSVTTPVKPSPLPSKGKRGKRRICKIWAKKAEETIRSRPERVPQVSQRTNLW
jgi:hypothetical protein